MTLIGEFAAYREIAAGTLAIVPIDHALFTNIHARLLVKTGRPLPGQPRNCSAVFPCTCLCLRSKNEPGIPQFSNGWSSREFA